MSYAQIIDLQTKSLVNTLLNDEDFMRFYLTCRETYAKFYVKNHVPENTLKES